MSFCCACAGSCNQVGPHSYCAAHGGSWNQPVVYVTQPHTSIPLPPTSTPFFDEAQAERLRREYERGRKAGYDEAVKMMRRVEDVLRKEKKK